MIGEDIQAISCCVNKNLTSTHGVTVSSCFLCSSAITNASMAKTLEILALAHENQEFIERFAHNLREILFETIHRTSIAVTILDSSTEAYHGTAIALCNDLGIRIEHQPGRDMIEKILWGIRQSCSDYIFLWTIDDLVAPDTFHSLLDQTMMNVSSFGGLRFTHGTGDNSIVRPRSCLNGLGLPESLLAYSASYEAYIYFGMRRDVALQIYRNAFRISSGFTVYQYANIVEYYVALASLCWNDHYYDSSNILQISSWSYNSLGSRAYSPSRDGVVTGVDDLQQLLLRLKQSLTHTIAVSLGNSQISDKISNMCIYNWTTANLESNKDRIHFEQVCNAEAVTMLIRRS